ncbi:Asp-tRNA(Asn)/Glu-tRNA(Gln) amidotransferase subunit GatB [bacterium]|jgi:aspartyl-tRNA(Asn)/glutamyl-tRNA(Gln) amidotransferase subunit B|nr:Asp-tRNA(Asn)/Glu-tRNA(Gln) amidotransferase subunit GatB [bacterium]
MSEFEAVIGLEVHCQLATDTKIFCGCKARPEGGQSVADVGANANTCPVCTGHPGTLPVLNKKVLEYAVRAGLATGCQIRLKNVFARKNYFYPDLPKGYQISQYDLPICENGQLNLTLKDGTTKQVHIQRIHMEEDAGKNVHLSDFSLVNLNRACVPLIEIVSGPDMKTSEEAGAYLRALYAIVTSIDICDGNMQEGNFRCDANVSVMPKGSKTFGTRAEIKNVNSFRFVEKAIDYEIQRQIEVIKSGGKVVQETRLYDSQKNVTQSMRSKEEAHDYRYFPEPDLIPVKLEQAWVDKIKNSMPELPEQKKTRYASELGLSLYDAGVITGSKTMASFFEMAVQKLGAAAKPAANFLTGEVARLLNEENIDISQSKLRPEHIAEVVKLTQDGTISSTGAKQVIASAWKTGDPVSKIVDQEGLKQVSDVGALEPAINKVIAGFPQQVAEYRSGKEKLIGFFVGQVMKETGGKANPGMLQDLIKKKLSS